MHPSRRSAVASLGLLCAVFSALALVLVLAGAGHVSRPDVPTSRAVQALVTGGPEAALAAVPDDFSADRGYTPVVRGGLLERADGDCSAPVPVPASFEPACRRHDFGYDLLRHAEVTGGTLPGLARRDVDDQFARAAMDSCSGATDGWTPTSCRIMAGIAATALRVNTLRQGDLAPGPETAVSVGAGVAAVGAVGTAAALVWIGLTRVLRRRPAPPVWRSGGLAAGLYASLLPSFLPRSGWVQGLTTLLFVVAAAAVVRRLVPTDPLSESGRYVLAALAALGGLTLVVQSAAAQVTTRQRMGLPPVDTAYGLGAVAAVVAVVGAVRGARWMWQRRRVTWKPVVGLGLVGSLVLQAVPSQAAPIAPTVEVTTGGALRVYAGLSDGDTAEQRAAAAVRRLVDAGGLDRGHVVLAMPTGSGWVDPRAVEGLERRFGDDVAIVSVQYAAVPSWLAFLFMRHDGDAAARALYAAVEDRISQRPEGTGPSVHVYGESLGALAGQAIFTDPGQSGAADGVCSALWVGSPGSARAGIAQESLVSNETDPVAHTSAWMLVRPTRGDRPWLPVVSYVLTGADFVGSLTPEAGDGHRYGPDQVDGLGSC